METKDIQLWCILVDHQVNDLMTGPLLVDIPPGAPVATLKEKILLEMPSLQHVDASSLTVWKCPGLIISEDDKDILEARIHRLDISKEEAQRLFEVRRVSSLSMAPGEALLVQMPGTYSHSILLYLNDLPLPLCVP